MSLFNTFAKEIYEDNTYLKVREVFESKVEDYLHQKTDYIETFIEEVSGEIFFKRKKKLIGFTQYIYIYNSSVYLRHLTHVIVVKV